MGFTKCAEGLFSSVDDTSPSGTELEISLRRVDSLSLSTTPLPDPPSSLSTMILARVRGVPKRRGLWLHRGVPCQRHPRLEGEDGDLGRLHHVQIPGRDLPAADRLWSEGRGVQQQGRRSLQPSGGHPLRRGGWVLLLVCRGLGLIWY